MCFWKYFTKGADIWQTFFLLIWFGDVFSYDFSSIKFLSIVSSRQYGGMKIVKNQWFLEALEKRSWALTNIFRFDIESPVPEQHYPMFKFFVICQLPYKMAPKVVPISENCLLWTSLLWGAEVLEVRLLHYLKGLELYYPVHWCKTLSIHRWLQKWQFYIWSISHYKFL